MTEVTSILHYKKNKKLCTFIHFIACLFQQVASSNPKKKHLRYFNTIVPKTRIFIPLEIEDQGCVSQKHRKTKLIVAPLMTMVL